MVVAQARAESVGGGPAAQEVASPAGHSRARIERLVVADQEVAVAQAQEDVVPALPRGEHAGGIVADDDVVAAPSGYAVRRVGVADHDVPALPGPEPVVAVAGRGALRRVVVADHEVVAGAAADHVSAIDAAGVDVVADEDVVAAIAVDLVVA